MRASTSAVCSLARRRAARSRVRAPAGDEVEGERRLERGHVALQPPGDPRDVDAPGRIRVGGRRVRHRVFTVEAAGHRQRRWIGSWGRRGAAGSLATMAIDVTDTSFQTDVIDRSSTTPVVVDLWAPWCGPCKTLGPILEKVVGETGGQVVLAKVNVDENPKVSQAFQVQGIPAVYAVAGGKVVDGFVGAQPEGVVREFVGRLQPSEADQEIARLLAAGDEASLRQVLDTIPDHHDAIVALAELLVGRRHDGDIDEALALLGRIPETPETRRIAALARTADGVAGPDGDGDSAEIVAKLDDPLGGGKAQ